MRKHGGQDRTGDFLPRSKITSDLARAINDGLYYYEQDLKKQHTTTPGTIGFEKTVDVVSNEQFSKLKNLEIGTSQTVKSSKKELKPTPKTHETTTAPSTIAKKPAIAAPSFVPHSLPTENTLMPSFRQLMSHVNAIKSGSIANEHARAASNGAGSGIMPRKGYNSGSSRTAANFSMSSKMRYQKQKTYHGQFIFGNFLRLDSFMAIDLNPKNKKWSQTQIQTESP